MLIKKPAPYDSAGFLLTSEVGTFTPNNLGQISAISQGLYQRNASGAWVAESVPHAASYDALGRLKTFTAAGSSTEFKRALAYDWDDNGNRKLATFSEAGILRNSAASVIGTGSNRLERLSSHIQTTNAAGEHLQLGSLGLTYDNAGRLSQTTHSEPFVQGGGVRKPAMPFAPASHFYNGLNQRVLRENPQGQTVYVYGSHGHNVLGEYQPPGTSSIRWSNGLGTEHVWLPTASGPMPVAAVINGEHFAVHADHLNMPRRLTDRNGNPRWQWAYSGFGEVGPQSLTTATLPEVRFNLRYPGQVDDANGLFYNWHRFYQPATGRYTQADPIGLEGGWNRFGYVGGNAVSFSDRTGLWAGVDDAIFAGGGALAGIAGQGASDWLSGNLSGWEDYVGSAIGGAAFGETLLYAGPVAAGLVGGAVTNASKQGLKNLTHKQCGFNWTSLGVDTAVGGLTGFIPGRPRISGINSGRNSTSAIYKQMATKFRNGTISSVTAATAGKMFVGRAYDTAVPYGVAGGAAAGAIGGPLIPGYSDSCECK